MKGGVFMTSYELISQLIILLLLKNNNDIDETKRD